MKALMLRAEPWRFGVLQVLRPLRKEFCYSGPFSAVRLTDIKEPELPSREWVKIRTILCGFCGSDLNLIMMKDSPTAMPFTSFPCVPGHEICGEIVEKGDDAGDWKAGDIVLIAPPLSCESRGISPLCRSCSSGMSSNCENFAEGVLSPGLFTGICRDINGGFAPYVTAHRSQLFRVPAGTPPEHAVLTEPLACSLQAALDNMPEKGDRVLIIGGGVIGILLLRALRALNTGCHITVVEPSEFAAEYARRSGAENVVAGNIIETAVSVAGGRAYKPLIGEPVVMGGFQRVYDTVGSRETLNRAMRALAAGGTLSVLGIAGDVKLDMTPLWLKLQTVRGCYAYGNYNDGKTVKPVFGMALDMISRGKVDVSDMLTHTFTLDQYRPLMKVNLSKGKHRAMKTAFRFQ